MDCWNKLVYVAKILLDSEFECYAASPADLFGIKKLAHIHHRGGSASIYFNRNIFRDIPAEAYCVVALFLRV